LIENLKNILLYNPKEPLLFNSGLFILLFLLVLFVYQILYKNKIARITFLTVFSLYFYYKSCGYYVLLIIASALIDFNLSNLIYKTTHPTSKKLWLISSLTLNLGLLAYFKYTNFFIDSYNQITGSTIGFINLFLPIGISFYTFENLSYTLDVYRNQFKPINNFIDYLFFLSFFPRLVAGPIVRASDFIPQINKTPLLTETEVTKGLFLIIGGAFKKVIISDYISINFVDRVFDNPTLYTSTENWLAVYGYTLQIYCDFSGYSDMAIGIALWLGFNIPENFKLPYKSTSITEFWRRWHISLSSWLKDYLYISLGGNRKGKFRTYLNLFITMLLGGLWHGASWKFVFWGALHGIALAIDKALNTIQLQKKYSFLTPLGWLLTFHFVAFCWIFFRASNFEIAIQIIQQISKLPHWELLPKIVNGYKLVFILFAVGYILHFIPDNTQHKLILFTQKWPLFIKAFLLALIIYLIAQVKSAEIQPFIYFQF
jgi:D-alanyl-lipoteichoic acid acyltransferase DltB (MBOAT superfamily)